MSHPCPGGGTGNVSGAGGASAIQDTGGREQRDHHRHPGHFEIGRY